MKLEFTREQKKALCRRYNNNLNAELDGFAGFAKEEKLALAMWQTEVLNKDSRLQSVRDSWCRWNQLAKDLIVEMLSEFEEVPTNKGMRVVLIVNEVVYTLCKHCGGTGVNYQRKNNKCDCMRGYLINNKIKLISDDEYKSRAADKYLSKLKKQRKLSRYNKEELVAMEMSEFILFTGVTAL